MNTADVGITTQEDLVRFPSLASLRAAHSDLLQRRRDSQETHEFLVEINDFIRQGQATGALLDTDDERWATQSLLDYWANALDHAGIEPPEATLAEFDPTLAPELDDALCPYRGLDAFREGSYFFGRQRLIETLVGCLDTQRLLAVLGPSGSGKSSLVLAGLLPALQAGALSDSQHWHYYPPMVPGPEPLASLARQIQPGGVNPAEWTTQQVEGLQHNPGHLVQLVGETSAAPAVLVVDQFEEVFTLCHDDHVRQAFVDNLLSFVQALGVKHTLILTMRSDFESQVARLPTFQPLFEQAQVRVTPLNADELREAIEKPAELIGLRFEEGIVNELVKEILGEPAGLPLLQFTLLKLWENRERNRVTWEAYRQLGGCRQALARSANAFYNALIPEEQVTARRILLRLARPGEGLEVTSNRVRRETLYQAGEAHDRVERVLDKLLQARLVRLTPGDTPDSDQVEVAHEALVRNWDTLVAWLEEERVTMRQRLRLTAAAEQWNALGKDAGALLRGTLLEEALRYTDLNELEARFVRASQEAAKAAALEKEAASQRELEQTKALAEEQRQRAEAQTQAARHLRYLSVALGVFAIAAIGFAGLAWKETRRAEEQTELAKEQTELTDGQRRLAIEGRQKAEAALSWNQFGQTPALSDIENKELWKLARQEVEVRQAFAKLIKDDEAVAAKFSEKPKAILRALAGLNTQDRMWLIQDLLTSPASPPSKIPVWTALTFLAIELKEDKALERLLQAIPATADPDQLAALGKVLAALAAKLPDTQTTPVVDRLLQAIPATADPALLAAWGKALAALATKLPDTQTTPVVDRLLQAIPATRDPALLAAWGKALAALAVRLPDTQTTPVVDRLLQSIQATRDPAQLAAWGKALAALAAKLPDTQTTPVVDRLLQAIQRTDDPDQLVALGEAIAALAAKLPTAQAALVVDRLLKAIQGTDDPAQLVAWGKALAALAAKLPTAQAALVVKQLLRSDTTDPDLLAALGKVLAALAAKLSDTQATLVVDRLLKAIQRTDDPAELVALGEALAALAAKLPTAQAAPVVDRLLQAIPATRDSAQLAALGKALAALAVKLPDTQTTLVVDRLLQAIPATTDPALLAALGEALAALAAKLPDTQTTPVVDRLLRAIPDTTDPALLAALANALAALAAKLPDDKAFAARIFDVLKYPNLAGADDAENRLLDAVHERFKDKGAPTRDKGFWAMVEWAETRFPDLNLKSPPKMLPGPTKG